MEKKEIPLKVLTADRRIRKGVVASSFTELLQKCKEKMGYLQDLRVKIVLEEDGTEIDDEFFSMLTGMSQLMVLKETEIWEQAVGVPIPSNNVSVADGQGPSTVNNKETFHWNGSLPVETRDRSLLQLVEDISKKQTSLDEDLDLPDLDLTDMVTDVANSSFNTMSVDALSMFEDEEDNTPDDDNPCHTPVHEAPVPVSNDIQEDHCYDSPVTINWPKIPTCDICKDRYCDSFLNCGHILCFVCACEIEERSGTCHICRESFTGVKKLFY